MATINFETTQAVMKGVSVTKFVDKLASELQRLEYSVYTVEAHCGSIRRIFKGNMPLDEQLFSIFLLEQWKNTKIEDAKNALLTHDYFLKKMNLYDMCIELYLTDRISNESRHRKYLHYIPELYKGIYEQYQNQLTDSMSKRTKNIYVTNCRQFLIYLEKNSICTLRDISFIVIKDFLSDAYIHHQFSMAKVIQMLDTFFGFVNEYGYTDFHLDFHMLKPSGCRKPVKPCFTYDEVSELLNVIDTTTRNGKRDYAIIICAVYTGMRSSDIYGLRLKDIDWKKDEIHVHQEKTGTCITLPLFNEVGNALADYILKGRPDSSEEYIFLRNIPPYVRLEGHCSGNTMLKRHVCRRH